MRKDRNGIWQDLAERVTAKLVSEGRVSSLQEDELLKLIEETIREFADERIVKVFFTARK